MIFKNSNKTNKYIYICLYFISLLFINNINKINGVSILKLLNNEDITEESPNNYNQNNKNNINININNNINININNLNDTKNDKSIDYKLNNKTTDILNQTQIQRLNEKNSHNNKVERIDKKEILDKKYRVIGNIVKQSIVYDKKINKFLAEIIINYNNSYHNHHYCKINIIISKQINVEYIHKYIYSFYNFDKEIKLICNYYDCLELFDYKRNVNKNDYYKCNILDNKQIKDEL